MNFLPDSMDLLGFNKLVVEVSFKYTDLDGQDTITKFIKL